VPDPQRALLFLFAGRSFGALGLKQMETRTFVTFDWAAPDEEEVDSEGEVVPAGKDIMEAIRSAMSERGFKVTRVEQHDSYGWCFDTEVEGARVWSMLQSSDAWLLISNAPLSWIQKLRGRNVEPALQQVSRALHECLSGFSLARGMRWFTCEEFERGKGARGANAP
jgi:hypothetical protein